MVRHLSYFFLFLALIFFCLIFFQKKIVQARIGVGVGTAKIELNEELKPGGIYSMPPLTVRNTGDEESGYTIDIQYHEGVPELRPEKDWFKFDPVEFSLAPGESRIVNVNLHLPMKIVPGKYFCYAEAGPTKKSENAEGAVIGIAAAAKVYFTVVPANLWQAFYYKMVYLWKFYSPWSHVLSALIILISLWLAFKRKFSFNISLKKKDHSKKGEGAIKEEGDHEKFEKIFVLSFSKMEKYSSSFSSSQTEEIFREARELAGPISSFFLSHDPQVLDLASPELKNILLLSREGLEEIEKKFPQYFKKAQEMIISGITGKKFK